ncbi:MAG TPA: hypothetical protein VKE69_07640 [Planctomycetota bacterium]|nr:hypothetical protein [Planctomycetota bacterium]
MPRWRDVAIALLVALVAAERECEPERPWRWWRCVYGDGTVTYNEMRAYRDLAEATDYFHGRSPKADDDAFELIDGIRRRVDYHAENAIERETRHQGIRLVERIAAEPG